MDTAQIIAGEHISDNISLATIDRGSTVPGEHENGNITAGRPASLLEVDDNLQSQDGDTVYPTGPKLWLALSAMYTAVFLNGLVRQPREMFGIVS